jgi:hypothetical protein
MQTKVEGATAAMDDPPKTTAVRRAVGESDLIATVCFRQIFPEARVDIAWPHAFEFLRAHLGSHDVCGVIWESGGFSYAKWWRRERGERAGLYHIGAGAYGDSTVLVEEHAADGDRCESTTVHGQRCERRAGHRGNHEVTTATISRAAMSQALDLIEKCPNVPADDLAILREARASDEKVLDESAAEHVRNALQILDASFHQYGGRDGGAYVTYRDEDLQAVRARLQSALNVLESPTVLSSASLAMFVGDLAQRSV